MFEKIKQLKQLRDQAGQMKAALSQETVQADSAHGKISVVMDGNQEILALNIDEAMFLPEKKEEIEKAVKEAVNEAIKKSQKAMAQKIQSIGGLNIPGLGL
jgi:DNA-binding YbaB/EbfC family protein